ncbi:MAG: hypothetical protein M1819_001043 [Sarea resinae]|nr:MAG: hypothetical protein M1819_001043 [Sarea resinae]
MTTSPPLQHGASIVTSPLRAISTTAAPPFPPAALRPLITEIAILLRQRGESVSVAETAAGGIISASLLSFAGASKYYKGGLTLYTLESRIAFGGWTAENLKTYTGPTPAIVAGLAENVRERLGSTYTVCESGTAGPSGGDTPNRKPGYVALAVSVNPSADPNGPNSPHTITKELDTELGGDREANMLRFAFEALILLRDVIRDRGSGASLAAGGAASS